MAIARRRPETGSVCGDPLSRAAREPQRKRVVGVAARAARSTACPTGDLHPAEADIPPAGRAIASNWRCPCRSELGPCPGGQVEDVSVVLVAVGTGVAQGDLNSAIFARIGDYKPGMATDRG